jgi:uncharacterized membrane protein
MWPRVVLVVAVGLIVSAFCAKMMYIFAMDNPDTQEANIAAFFAMWALAVIAYACFWLAFARKKST